MPLPLSARSLLSDRVLADRPLPPPHHRGAPVRHRPEWANPLPNRCGERTQLASNPNQPASLPQEDRGELRPRLSRAGGGLAEGGIGNWGFCWRGAAVGPSPEGKGGFTSPALSGGEGGLVPPAPRGGGPNVAHLPETSTVVHSFYATFVHSLYVMPVIAWIERSRSRHPIASPSSLLLIFGNAFPPGSLSSELITPDSCEGRESDTTRGDRAAGTLVASDSKASRRRGIETLGTGILWPRLDSTKDLCREYCNRSRTRPPNS
jgi:hypothetical protein